MLVDSAIGIAVGAGIDGLVDVANVRLFGAVPLLAPLVTLGWSASLGGLPGATAGSKAYFLSPLVRDAIASGQIVLVVDAQRAQEAATAREVIQESVGDYKDVPTV